MGYRVVVLAAMVTASSAFAGRLVSIDPAVPVAALPGAPVSSFVAGASGKITLPADALRSTYLFRTVVEAADRDPLTVGSVTEAVRVTLALGDGQLEARKEGAGEVLLRLPARQTEAGVEVDVSPAPGLTIEKHELTAAAQSQVLGVKQAPGMFSWAQKMELKDSDETVTVAVRYWFTRVPEAGFTVRDQLQAERKRVGFFLDSDHVNHWRQGRTVAVVLHPTLPEKVRAACREAVLAWNGPLRAATGQDMLTVEDGNGDELPGAPGKIVVYYFSENPGGEMGDAEGLAPSATDPLTGEIVSAHVLINGAAILDDGEGGAADKRAKARRARTVRISLPGGATLPVRCEPCDGLGAFDDEEPAGAEDPADAAASDTRRTARKVSKKRHAPQLVADTLIHEIGHALGLMHNFKGSADLAHYRAGEHSTSVMDYLLDLTTPHTPGAYDEAAIQYGYGGKPVDVMGDMFFGGDDDQGKDPDCNQFDAGEPLAFYLGQVRKLRRQGEAGKDLEDALTHLRYFVNNSAPERSAKAFEMLLQSLTRQGADATKERQAARQVLTSAGPKPPQGNDDEDPPPPYKPLTSEQLEQVTAGTSR